MSINWDVFMSSGLATALVGGIGYLLKRWFKKKDEQTLTKKQLGDQILRIVTEGDKSGFNARPRSYEHLLYIKNQLMGWDKEVYESFRIFITNWSMCAVMQDTFSLGQVTETTIDNTKKFQARAQEQVEFLLTTAHKWMR